MAWVQEREEFFSSQPGESCWYSPCGIFKTNYQSYIWSLITEEGALVCLIILQAGHGSEGCFICQHRLCIQPVLAEKPVLAVKIIHIFLIITMIYNPDSLGFIHCEYVNWKYSIVVWSLLFGVQAARLQAQHCFCCSSYSVSASFASRVFSQIWGKIILKFDGPQNLAKELSSRTKVIRWRLEL